MSYASVMVYVEADVTPEQRVRLAANLADRFGARLLGLSALAIPSPTVADGMVISAANEVDIKLMEATLANKGEWFLRTSGNGSRKPEWRAALDFPVEALAREARSADLIVISQTQGSGGRYRSLDAGSAILKVGRPTLVVPEDASSLRAKHVVIGWKDTREARRTVGGCAFVPATGDACHHC
jgi:hypothetical protein